jgi:serine/threonine protein kinase
LGCVRDCDQADSLGIAFLAHASAPINVTFILTSSSHPSLFGFQLFTVLRAQPHIIKYIESFLQHNDLYLVLELAERGDFAQNLARMRESGERFHELAIWRFLIQIASALAHMHGCRVMHRGANYMFRANGSCLYLYVVNFAAPDLHCTSRLFSVFLK